MFSAASDVSVSISGALLASIYDEASGMECNSTGLIFGKYESSVEVKLSDSSDYSELRTEYACKNFYMKIFPINVTYMHV